MANQKCPLCHGVASATGIDIGTKRRIDCPKCNTIIIAPVTITILENSPENQLQSLLKTASALEGNQVLFIYEEDSIEEGSGRTQKIIKSLVQPEDMWN